jgi:hypothetical protein
MGSKEFTCFTINAAIPTEANFQFRIYSRWQITVLIDNRDKKLSS